MPDTGLNIVAKRLREARERKALSQKALGIEWHETTKDGQITLEPVFCLGLCACGPAAIVDGKLVGRVDEARIDAIIGGLK